MQLHEEPSSLPYRILSYMPGALQTHVQTYTQNVYLTPEGIQPWVSGTVDSLQIEDFAEIVAYQPQIIIIGTGAVCTHFPVAAIAALQRQRIGVECLQTLSACHTFMVLADEGRRVVAALIL